MKCPKCGYEWLPRVPKPKVCPKCHHFLKEEDYEVEQTETYR